MTIPLGVYSLICRVTDFHPSAWGAQSFYMLFVGLKENALSKINFSYNLYGVQLCTYWTNMQPFILYQMPLASKIVK